MKILVACNFDPCGVAVGHRELMRAAGHDYRVVVRFAPAGVSRADCVGEPNDELLAFARHADVIQFCPGIGDGGGWSTKADAPFVMEDLPDALAIARTSVRVAYFHGSVATWAQRAHYAAFYGGRGWRMATSTLDYARELPAAYLPPYIDGLPRAALREENSPLVIAHTPTNPSNCHTAEFLGLVQRLRWSKKLQPRVEYASGVPHAVALDLKAHAHAHFDHLRGSFSVNTLEAAAIGLVPLVGLKSEYVGHSVPPLQPRIEDYDSLKSVLGALCDDVALTRELQNSARVWFEKNFSAAAVTRRLLAFYERL